MSTERVCSSIEEEEEEEAEDAYTPFSLHQALLSLSLSLPVSSHINDVLQQLLVVYLLFGFVILGVK